MISPEEQLELSLEIDKAINILTKRYIDRDLFDLKQSGYTLPNQMEMPHYVMECRQAIVETLQESN